MTGSLAMDYQWIKVADGDKHCKEKSLESQERACEGPCIPAWQYGKYDSINLDINLC